MGSMNELVQFIHNVLTEDRIYDSSKIIDIHASLEETFFQLISSTGFGWVPSIDEMNIIWEMLSRLGQDDLDRLFYKNNLFHFIDNKEVKKAILYIRMFVKTWIKSCTSMPFIRSIKMWWKKLSGENTPIMTRI